MWTKNGPKVIEFNARFGDPEAEVILPKLESDLIEIIQLLKQGKKPSISWNNFYYLGVVMAKQVYPEQYLKGFEIIGLQDIEPFVYHMGTKLVDNKLVTNGGRVLLVLGKGSTLEEAKNMAYHHISKIQCNQLIYRTDIGYRALKGT